MAQIKLGIIGFGFMGHEHYKMMKSFDEITVTAICDRVPEMMEDITDEGIAYCDGFDAEGKCVTTEHLLTQVPGSKPLGAEGPTRSFGTPAPGLILTSPLPEVQVSHRNFFENYLAAMDGREELMVKPEEVRRTLAVMEACRKSSALGRSVDFE